MSRPSVAMVGSFRKHLAVMEETIEVFNAHGIEVVNPLDVTPLDPSIDFVRFASDEADLTDAEVQSKALQRILGAEVVYVVCPDGYTGNTTNYEWGWIEAQNASAYFSELPDRWYMRRWATDRIITPLNLAQLILNGDTKPLQT